MTSASSKERKKLIAILRDLERDHQKAINRIWDKYLENEEKDAKDDPPPRD